MPVTNTTCKLIYLCTGAQTVFPYTFRIFQDSDLTVTKHKISDNTEIVLTLNTDYTVSGAGDDSGGNVTTVGPAFSTDYKLIIQRILPLTQLIDFVEYDIHPADAHDDGLDKLTMICQQLDEVTSRAIQQGITSVTPNLVIPALVTGKYLHALTPTTLDWEDSQKGDTGVQGLKGDTGVTGAGGITRGTFVNADLVAGVLTITHSKGLSAPYSLVVFIFDNSGNQIIPDQVTGATNSVDVDLTSYGTLTGTWGYALG